MERQTVEIRINRDGGFSVQAKSGFSGTSCVKQTHQLEVALGGHMTETKHTSDYYRPDADNPVNINLK